MKSQNKTKKNVSHKIFELELSFILGSRNILKTNKQTKSSTRSEFLIEKHQVNNFRKTKEKFTE